MFGTKRQRGDAELGVVLVVIVLLLLLILGGIRGCHGVDFSDGNRVGTLYKFSKQGLVWKTWEGEMALQAGPSGMTASTWDFTFDPDMAPGVTVEQMNGYLKSGQKIEVKYQQRACGWSPHGKTDYFLISVSPIETSGK